VSHGLDSSISNPKKPKTRIGNPAVTSLIENTVTGITLSYKSKIM